MLRPDEPPELTDAEIARAWGSEGNAAVYPESRRSFVTRVRRG